MKRYAPCIPEEALPGSMCEREDGEYYAVSDVNALIVKVAELSCPEAAGFEGPDTFSDCGKCVVCECRKLAQTVSAG